MKPSKCVIILSTVKVSDNNILRVKDWLSANCPEWADFQIKDTGKYLGRYLGPGAGALQWKGPLGKFKARVLDLSAERAPLNISARQFASKCVSVLGYVAQLVNPPSSLTRVELNAGHRIFRIPPGALDTESAYSLDAWGPCAL